MTNLKQGDKAPHFSLPSDSHNDDLSLDQLAGKKLVIFFYPKDNTPGCTKEGCAFRDTKNEFEALGTTIIGVSKNSIKDHLKFRKKQNFNFPLLSDENGTMCEDYGVWTQKNTFGKTYMGIERTTFLISEDGVILNIWEKVKVANHVEEVLNTVKSQAS